MHECLDGPDGCQGEVNAYLALSGSGMRWPRCEHHYALYVERLQPVIDDIERRYPRQAPDDFDPYYAGESWDDEQ